MIHIECNCGESVEVPNGFLGEAAECMGCHAELWLSAAAPPEGKDAAEIGARLTVRKGPKHKHAQYILAGRDPIWIGKQVDREIILEGQSVSRSHCRIVRRGAIWSIEDHASTNGLYINGKRSETHVLRDGDVLVIGDYELLFQLGPKREV